MTTTTTWHADDTDILSLSYTVWPDLSGKLIQRMDAAPWESLARWIEMQPPRETKTRCPLLKLAAFGDRRTETGSLRNDANVLRVYGIEGDYDAGEITPEQAIERLESYGLRATVYTSWGHTTEAPRWRVLAPLARPVEPAARLAYAETLNGLLWGALAPESGVLSQSYFVGRNPAAEYKALHTFDDPTDGFCLDDIDGIQAERVAFKAEAKPGDPDTGAGSRGSQDDYLAELLAGDDVHGNALRIIGRLVREGFSDATIKVVFHGLAVHVATARGQERAAGLTGSELQRMITGARAKGYARESVNMDEFLARIRGETPRDPGSTEPETPKRIFTMVGDLIANPKPPAWLLQDILEQDTLALIYGPPKKGKSFVAVDWMCSIATGTPCHGHPAKQAPVFYICGEGHNGLARRFLAWSLARGISLAGAPIAVSNRALPMTHPGAVRAVSEAVEELRAITGMDPGLIVVDTLARNFGANENDTEAMSVFITHLDAIREPFKATALIVHHSGKDETRGARGSTVLFGAIDASYVVTRDELGMVSLTPEAMKDAALPPAQIFGMTPVSLPIESPDGTEVTSCVLSPLGGDYTPPQRGKAGRGKNQTRALMHLNRLYEEHRARVERSGRDPDEARVLVADWRSACLDDGIAANRWPEVLSSLQSADRVCVEAIYVRPLQ